MAPVWLPAWFGIKKRRPQIDFVYFARTGEGGGGKVSPNYFFPRFSAAIEAWGQLSVTSETQAMRDRTFAQRQEPVILVYSEVRFHKDALLRDEVLRFEQAAHGRQVLHPPALAKVCADKEATNRAFSSAGIPMPRMVPAGAAPTKVFSNVSIGTHARVTILGVGERVDPERYNTEFIDTVHEHDGRLYYVVLRAICVGRVCIAVYVRARPVEDGDASVHNKDTPLDPAMLNSFYQQIVTPRRPEIDLICTKLGDMMGIGFYSHDLLPEAGTGRTLLCETGFKFDDMSLRRHMAAIRDQIAFGGSIGGDEVERAARAFVAQI